MRRTFTSTIPTSTSALPSTSSPLQAVRQDHRRSRPAREHHRRAVPPRRRARRAAQAESVPPVDLPHGGFMLKKRLVGVVVVRDGLAVQSIGFHRYLPIGIPEIVVSFLDRWGIDEIMVLDISATREQRLDTALVAKVSRSCQVPITYGGGIRRAEDIRPVSSRRGPTRCSSTRRFAGPDGDRRGCGGLVLSA